MRHRTMSAVALAVAVLLSLGWLGIGAVSPVAAQDDSVTVTLASQDDSGVTGTVTLSKDGNQTIVTTDLEGSEAGYEGHMFDSTCDDHASATVFYAINAVDEEGKSKSTVDAPFSELTTGDFWVHMHRPAGERGVGVACGQVLAAQGSGGTLPKTGVGSLSGDQTDAWLIVGMMTGALALGGSLALRGRRGNLG